MTRPTRILIITNGPLARNPRVVKEATTLGEAGYDVTVLTPRNHAPSEPYDKAISADAPFRRQPVDLIPGYSLSKWRIFFRLLPHRLGREMMTRLHVENLHALGPARLLLHLAEEQPADLTIVHNEISHAVGLQLLARGRRVAADIEDWHSEDLPPEARRTRPLRLLRLQEHKLLHRAVYCSTTSDAMADALHQRYGGTRPYVITNSFLLGPRRAGITDDRPPRFLWFSQTIGPGRGLEQLIDAWATTKKNSELILLGEDCGGYIAHLHNRVPESHRARLHIKSPIAPLELPKFIACHDIGLALEPSTPLNKDLTISNKILQYLNAGLAVVATPTSGQREVLSYAPQAGLILENLSDPLTTAATLDTLLSNPALIRSRQIAARKLAEEKYCWEREAPRLVALVRQALSS